MFWWLSLVKPKRQTVFIEQFELLRRFRVRKTRTPFTFQTLFSFLENPINRWNAGAALLTRFSSGRLSGYIHLRSPLLHRLDAIRTKLPRLLSL